MKNQFVFDYNLAYGDEGPGYDYADYGMTKQDLTLPMLPPPKRFLMRGSTYWVSDNVKYMFIDESHRVPCASEIRVQKYHNIEDTKLRLLKLNYFFIRNKDCMTEKKKGFSSIVYNVETKALYLIRANPYFKTTKKGKMAKKHNWKKSIVRLSLNNFLLDMYLSNYDSTHRERFIDDLFRIVSKDVPGVRIECNGEADSIIALILQHRIGKALPGLNDNCINNLGYITSHKFISSRLDTILNKKLGGQHWQREYDYIEHGKLISKLKRKSLYKFIPELDKTNSLRKALQVLLGECYVNIFPKLIFDIDFQMIARGDDLSFINYKENMPKSVQHYVSNSLGKMPMNKFEELFKEVMDLSRTSVDDNIKDNWIRTVRRLNTTVPWRAWYDTYRMAGQLGLRIRPNGFESVEEIWNMHDRLSNIIRRRDRISSAINISDTFNFVEVKYPKVFKGYTFRQLIYPRDLQNETAVMGHCVHSYKYDCAKGHSVIFSATNPEGKRYTVEYETDTYNFAQAEGSYEDNNGMRNICSNELNMSVFIPFASVLAQRNSKLNYQALSMLNLTITESFEDVKAIEDTLDITPGLAESMGPEDLDNIICRRNYLLEELLTIHNNIDDNTNYAALINDVDNLLNIYGFSKNGGQSRPRHRFPNIAAPGPAVPVPMNNLFPEIATEAAVPNDTYDLIEAAEEEEFPF